MRIFLTGANGFIGGAVAAALIADGHAVRGLVRDQARTWAINRYMPGSIAGVSVSSRDEEGRPAKIVAHYTFNGFNGRTDGSVTLTFSEGLPSCMYFYDFPATCRTPDRRIVAAYGDGAYKPE